MVEAYYHKHLHLSQLFYKIIFLTFIFQNFDLFGKLCDREYVLKEHIERENQMRGGERYDGRRVGES